MITIRERKREREREKELQFSKAKNMKERRIGGSEGGKDKTGWRGGMLQKGGSHSTRR